MKGREAKTGNGCVIPCEKNADLRKDIERFADDLRTRAHLVDSTGLSNAEIHASGLFRGAIERLRGQMSASMKAKRAFTASILDHLKRRGFIRDWTSAGAANRHDYGVTLTSGRYAVIESKGCLDGNNTTIFDRPPHADEFVVWSICQNPGSDPRKGAWSGIHTRLSAEIVSRGLVVDGLVIWDGMCGTVGRPCPKVASGAPRTSVTTPVGDLELPPPCIYLFPRTVPSPRSNPEPPPHEIAEVEFLSALHDCFGGRADELNKVAIKVAHQGSETVRTTTVNRGGDVVATTRPTAIKRK